jgi:predicted nucleic acid-binding protein
MFLDTSGLLCFLDRRDRRHTEALRLYQNARVRLTNNYVLAEYVALAHVRGLPR